MPIPFHPAEFVALRDAPQPLAAVAAYRWQPEAVVGDPATGGSWLLGSAGISAELLPPPRGGAGPGAGVRCRRRCGRE